MANHDHLKSLVRTEPEAARLLHPNMSPRTLARWRRQGIGPHFVKVGRKVGYTDDAIEAFLERQTRSHNAESRRRG